MANELDNSRKTANSKTKKLSSIIDFSALVSLSFLLTIFYMLTSAMSRPQTIALSAPPDCCDCWPKSIGCGENRSVTILLAPNNKIVCYQGVAEMPLVGPKTLTYGKFGIRKTLCEFKDNLNKYNRQRGKNSNNLVVFIKPSNASNYKNLVDILDEMAIICIKNYTIVNDFSPEERKLINDI